MSPSAPQASREPVGTPDAVDDRARATLGIGDLAAQTGVSVPTLRMWEARHGFPIAHRLPSGHRRYTERDRDLVAHVLRDRRAGLSLEAAVQRARRAGAEREPSLFAGLRARSPALAAAVLSKRAMLAVSRAIEDECCARAARGIVIGAFQESRHYVRAKARWGELARTAEVAIVFADFGGRRDLRRRPVELPLDPSAPLRREWAVVCDAPGNTACLAGWELPGQPFSPDDGRRFEAVWTTDPAVVRHATNIALGLAAADAPRLVERCRDLVAAVPPAGGDEPGRTLALTNRIVAYLDDGRADRTAPR